MNEIPEIKVLADQVNRELVGKVVKTVTAWQNPHKFAFITGDPNEYGHVLTGKKITGARGFGGWLEIKIGDAMFSISEGTRLLYTENEKELMKKHQMLMTFEDGSYLCASVQMYGGLICTKYGDYNDGYYTIAQEKPDILSDAFTEDYFLNTADASKQKLSVKAFLATEQRFPGLGNGVLQDILFNAGIHPKRKLEDITRIELKLLYQSVRETLSDMYNRGGRDTEKDLFGHQGGYSTKMSKMTKGLPCALCGAEIKKESYMGGSVYFCPDCQKV